MSFVETLKENNSLKTLLPASAFSVYEAERALHIHFSNEYKEYLLSFGVAVTDEHEFTGLCSSPRLNVIKVTERERNKGDNHYEDLYVVEKINIDRIVIWQNETGTVFQSVNGSIPFVIANSLEDYLQG